MPARIGKMRDRVRIEKPSATVDSHGQPVKGWTAVRTVWAEVQPLPGKELFQAAQVQALTTDRVKIHRDKELEEHGPKWRLVVTSQGERVLNVVAVRWADPRGEYLEILCSGEGARL